jgi:hypothetical protein
MDDEGNPGGLKSALRFQAARISATITPWITSSRAGMRSG